MHLNGLYCKFYFGLKHLCTCNLDIALALACREGYKASKTEVRLNTNRIIVANSPKIVARLGEVGVN